MQVVGVRTKKVGKILFFETNGEKLQKGDLVLVETSRGLECAKVVIAPRDLQIETQTAPLVEESIEKVIRKLTSEDLIILEENRADEKKAFEICSRKIKEHGLPMELTEVEYMFDISKIIFSFTAKERIDFRELVQDLASIFRTRIELHQIGVRDKARILGGYGCCGRQLCCATFLNEFLPVSIRMAKEQGLALNPSKISGVCGRLLCCLKYEDNLKCVNCSDSENNHSDVVAANVNENFSVKLEEPENIQTLKNSDLK